MTPRVRRAAATASVLAVLAAGCSDDDDWVSRPTPAEVPESVAFADDTAPPDTTASVSAPPTTFSVADGMETERTELLDAMATWAERDSAAQRYVVEWVCDCDAAVDAVLVTVTDDVVTAAVQYGPEVLTVEAGVLHDEGVAIDGPSPTALFAEIEEALAAGRAVEADYDPDTGLPVRIAVDGDDPVVEVRSFVDISEGQADLIDAQRRWENDGYPRYTWTYGVITPIGPVEESVSVDGASEPAGLTVDGVHARIAEALADPTAVVRATYDDELGLPAQVSIERPLSADVLPFTFTGVTALEPA